MTYRKQCSKCGEENTHEVKYDRHTDQLHIKCPVCGYTFMRETHERTIRTKTGGTDRAA